MTSKPDFFQNCLIAAPELEIQKTPPCALKEISSFFMQFFSARDTETLIHRYPFRRGSSTPTAHSAASACLLVCGVLSGDAGALAIRSAEQPGGILSEGRRGSGIRRYIWGACEQDSCQQAANSVSNRPPLREKSTEPPE